MAEKANASEIPVVGAGCTELYLETVQKAAEQITSPACSCRNYRAVLSDCRLMDVEEALVNCIANEGFILVVLEKTQLS